MKSTLVGPVTAELDPGHAPVWDGYEPPLGLLTIASILRHAGSDTAVFDLDGFLRESIEAGILPRDAFRAAVSVLASHDADLYGFGTICNSYPLTIRIAGEIRRLRPDARIVFGGPQATAVDVATLETFEFVDAVIRGEVDQMIAEAFEKIVSGGLDGVSGVTHRRGGKVVRNPDAPLVLDLDAGPPPAFDLCLYARRCARLPVEIGRGCPFACTFCSTNDFFRRRFRMRSPEGVLKEMQRLNDGFGVTDFDLVHDMFTVDRKRVLEFCQFMEGADSGFTWHCSARTDFVDRELIERMRAAGCGTVFFGVETGSARLQKIIGKDLGVEEAAGAVQLIEQAGMRCTVSLIIGFPEETIDDLNATARFALNSARLDSANVQVGLLAPLAGTPLYRQWRGQMFFDEIVSEQSQSAWIQDEADRVLIRRHADLFSSYYGLPAGTGREYVGEFRWFFKYLLKRCRWLALALGLQRDAFSIFFDLWKKNGGPREPAYYSTFEFVDEFCHFVLLNLTAGGSEPDAVEMMAKYYQAMYSVLRRPMDTNQPNFHGGPQIATGITIVDFSFSPARVIELLRQGLAPDGACLQPAWVTFRRKGDQILDGRELPGFAAAVLRLCDGKTSIPQMVAELGSACPAVPGITPSDFLRSGLEILGRNGLVSIPEFSRSYVG